MNALWKYILGFVALLTLAVWISLGATSNGNLQIIACDVGQGDGLLIQQGNSQILIDGGPNSKVIDCLSKYVNIFDRHIELVINTHPEKDHYAGLIDVFERYEVENLITSGLNSSSSEYQVLEKLVGGSKTEVVHAYEGQSIRLGLMYLDILNPSKNDILSSSTIIKSSEDKVLGDFNIEGSANNLSIVAVLSYKNFDALFTGDFEDETSDMIAENYSERLKDMEYLKVPHHGSKNGLSQKLLDNANFQVAVISAGARNSYGHPHKEVLDILDNAKIETFRTDQIGDVVIESDGEKWWRR